MIFNTFLISVLLLLTTGCAHFKTVKIDEKYLAKNAIGSYNYSRTKCYEAAKNVIKEMGGDIEKEKKSEFKFMSNKFNALSVIQGNSYSAAVINEDHKFYIGVTGDKKSCVVKVLKYRAWTNNKKLTKVREQYVRFHIFNPFFSNLKIKLEDSKF